jgi:hypothetical protein
MMTMSKLRTHLLTAAASVALMAAAGQAFAGEGPFTFDTSLLQPPGSYPAGVAFGNPPNIITGQSITLGGAGNGGVLFNFASGPTSDFDFNGVSIGTQVQPPTGQGLNVPALGMPFGLDIVVSGHATYTSSTGSTNHYDLAGAGDFVNWTMYAAIESVGHVATATSGNAATNTAPTLVANGATLIPIAFGTVLGGSNATGTGLGIDINAISTFNICGPTAAALPTGTVVAGADPCGGAGNDQTGFFASPAAFYTVAEDSWTSTATGITSSGNNVLSSNMNGTFDFPVPEPATLGLFGAALFGMGWVQRRRNKKA